ncbi:MAG: transcriptional repressor LexA [Candidatus Margulisiibacteriota bacterium]
MRNPITSRQKELLLIIYDYIKGSGFPPTFEEMRERLGVSSNQSVVDLLGKLQSKSLIKKNESGARSIALLPLSYEILGRPPLVAFLGVTSAGSPLETVEITGEWQEVSNEVSRLKEDVFLLKISGDSMINAGIDDGDVVMVKSAKEFYHGEIVLTQIGDTSTVKRFMSEDKPPYVYLKPENPDHKIIPFNEFTMSMTGKVISVLKNGYWRGVK